MKNFLLHFLFALIGSLMLFSNVAAQPARILYVTSERTAVLAKTVGSPKVDTLFAAASLGNGSFVKPKNLSVLASTSDGKSLLIGGKLVLQNPINNAPDSFYAIMRIDSPFTNGGYYNPLATPNKTIGKYCTILKTVYVGTHFIKPLPLGLLTPDEKEYYVTWEKSGEGNGEEWFFHGNLDGSGTVDSMMTAQLIPSPSAAADHGFHMSNLITSEDGKTLIWVMYDRITTTIPRARLFSWTISRALNPLLLLDISSYVPLTQKGAEIDLSFGFLLRILHYDGTGTPQAELAFSANIFGNLVMYSFPYNDGASAPFTIETRTINKSKLPNSLNFFTGITGNPLKEDDGKEVITPTGGTPDGAGGDIMFSSGGDSVVFVTNGSDNIASPASSGIYIYNLLTSQVTLVQNDPNSMERQPIFMGHPQKKDTVTPPPPPPKYKVGTAFFDNTQLVFGDHFIGDDSTLSVTLKDTTSSLVYVTAESIGGADANAFSITSPLQTSLPDTIHGHKDLAFSVKFTPAEARPYTATLIVHYQDSLKKGEKDSVVSVQLDGGGKTKPSGAVHGSSASAFDVFVTPNPFTSSTQISVTAREAGSTKLEVRDLLGKEIYSSKALTLGAGEKFNYLLDGAALHLTPGAYFVIVRSAQEEITRQVIYIGK